MDMQSTDPSNSAGTLGAWMKRELEIRLPIGWLAAGGIVFLALLITALD